MAGDYLLSVSGLRDSPVRLKPVALRTIPGPASRWPLTRTESRREFARPRRRIGAAARHGKLSGRQNLGTQREKAVNSSDLPALRRKSAPRVGFEPTTNRLTALSALAAFLAISS
jgi:hypothetical protein